MEFSTLRINSSDQDRVYLDHNAATPIASRVAKGIPEWLKVWGNPSSIHATGRGPKVLLRDARDSVAKMIQAGSPLEIVFTSGGSESNNAALKGVYGWFQKPNTISRPFRHRYLVSAVEHPSVKKTSDFLQDRGAEVVIVPVNRRGEIDIEFFANALDEKTALASVMLANNETGTLFPIRQLADLAHAKGVLFHSDCVQALGKIPIDVRELGVDLASFSGHKFYSLKGAGVLYLRKGVSIESLVHGGGQERHRRGGTENVLAIAAMGAMCELRDQVMAHAERVQRLRDDLERRIIDEIPGVSITAVESQRLPGTSSLVIDGIDGETLLMNLDMSGYSVSTGAACSSGSPEPSPVLIAMGLSRLEAQSSLRIGLGWENTESEVDRFVAELVKVVSHLRSFNRRQEDIHVHP